LYNEIASPSGLTDAPKFEETTANDRHGFYQYVIIADGAVTASVFTKQIDRRYIHFQSDSTGSGQSSYVDLQDGSVVSEGTGWTLSAEDYGNGWWRISATATGVAGSRYFIWGTSLNGTTSTYVGDGSEFTFWGFQAEAGSYPTSYIPNHSGGSVTRGGDNCSTSNNSLLEQTSATYFLELTPIEILSNNLIEVRGDGSTSNRIIFQTTSSGGIRVLVRAQGSSILDQNVSSAVSQNTKVKVALKYTPSNISFFVDGVKKIDTDVSVDFNPELNGLDLEGSATSNDDALKQHQFLFFPEALSDADCITLTTL